MKLPELIPGRFIRRDNRFRATIEIDGRQAWAHVPNSGRLTELFTGGQPIWAAPAQAAHRKTAYDLKLVEYNDALVSVDARLPNPLLAEALAQGKIPGMRYPDIRQEVSYGDSRLDFRLSGPHTVCWAEAKSVTLVKKGTALFPDAPTSRGRKHLLELIRARQAGNSAAVIFVIQRPDADQFRPFVEADPDFAQALQLASNAGVAVRAFTCRVSLEEIAVSREIPVILP